MSKFHGITRSIECSMGEIIHISCSAAPACTESNIGFFSDDELDNAREELATNQVISELLDALDENGTVGGSSLGQHHMRQMSKLFTGSL